MTKLREQHGVLAWKQAPSERWRHTPMIISNAAHSRLDPVVLTQDR